MNLPMQPKKFLENSNPDFFYTQLPEDEKFELFQSHYLLNSEGIVSSLSDQFDSKVFFLDKTACERAQSIFRESIFLNGRKNELSPGITTSIEEISRDSENYAQNILEKKFKLLLKGGGVLYVVKSMIQKIFDTWGFNLVGKHELLTPSFRALLEFFPNDFDWEFGLEGGMDQEVQQRFIENSITQPLAAKFKKLECNPYELVLKILNAKARNRSIYFATVMKKYTDISAKMQKLEHLCIEAFAFTTAAEVNTPRSIFSLRTLRNEKQCHDCFFPIKSSILATMKESLAIDMRPLLNKNFTPEPLVLSSVMGGSIEKVLQALSDRNLLLITFDPTMSADVSDFGRTVSYFTLGGRCYQKGWIPKIVDALKQGCIDQELPLSKLLEKQLINRLINHHKNEPAILIALTFNASALLYWIDPLNEGEIQKLWQLVFSYIDTIENNQNAFLKAPVIERIHIFMRDPNFKFVDLYYIYIQLGSQIDQHRTRNSVSYPSQTEGQLFTQWRITFDTSNTIKPPVCALFFPFSLSSALEYVETLTEIPCPIPSFFHNIVSDKKLCFGFGESRLAKYAQDPRRQFKSSLRKALGLLHKKQESFWLLGFLTILPLLALQGDSEVLREVLEKFIEMLKNNWASKTIKQNCIALFCRTLNESRIEFPPRVFQAIIEKKERRKVSTYVELITALVKSGETAFQEYAYEHLKLIEVRDFDYATLKGLYTNLLYQSIELNRNESANPDINFAHLQWLDRLLGKIFRHSILLPETKLQLLIFSYQNLHQALLEKQNELEEKLFEGILIALEGIKKISFQQPNDISIWTLLLSSRNRSLSPLKAMRLIKALKRLNLWDLTEKMQIEMISQIDHAKKLDLSFYFPIHQPPSLKQVENPFDQIFAKLDGIKSHSDEIDKLFYLINQQIETKKAFERLDLILNKVRLQIFGYLSLEQRTELCRLLWKFQKNFSEKQPLALHKCLAAFVALFSASGKISVQREASDSAAGDEGIAPAIAEEADVEDGCLAANRKLTEVVNKTTFVSLVPETSLRSQLLESIYDLLKHPENCNIFLDDSYRRFIQELSSLPKQERVFMRQDSEKFLRIINARKMDQEIFDFCELAGRPPITSVFENFSIYMEALQRRKQDKNYPVSAENLEQFLLNAPYISQPTENLLSNLTEIYQFLTLSHQKSNSMIDAYEWFMKEIKIHKKINISKTANENFYIRAFRFTHELIRSKYFLEAYQVIHQFSFSTLHGSQWLKICLLFLQYKQPLYCTLLLEKKIPMSSLKEISYHKDWQHLFDSLISNCFTISKSENSSKEMLISMHTILYNIFKNNKPNSKEIWKLYFHVLTFNGPLKIVEEVFVDFLNSKTLPLAENEKKECWNWFIERFHKDGSILLLTNEKCWPQIETGCSAKPLKMLLKGALKACKVNKLDPEINYPQFEKIRNITGSWYDNLDNEFNRNLTYNLFFGKIQFSNQLVYYLAKLLFYSTNPLHLTMGAEAIVGILTDIESSPLLTKKAILLTNSYSAKMRNLKDLRSISAICTAILHSTNSPYCIGTDYNKFLSLVNELSESINIKEKKKKKSIPLGDTSITFASGYDRLKNKLVLKIIENPWIKSTNYNIQDKWIIGSSLREMLRQKNFNTAWVIKKNLTRVKQIVDPGSFDVIAKFFNNPRRWRDPTLKDHLLIQLNENRNEIAGFLQRHAIMHAYKRTMHLNILETEYKALKSSCCILTGVCLVPLLMITGVVMVVLSSLSVPNHANSV